MSGGKVKAQKWDTARFTQEEPSETNRTFSQTNGRFQNGCELAGIKVTPRQASKWRQQKGAAYNAYQKNKKKPDLN